MSGDGRPHFTPARRAQVVADLTWFRTSFGNEIRPALIGTPFTLEILAAIAMQETGLIWTKMHRNGANVSDILMHCVGDPLDEEDSRDPNAFPNDRHDLESVGQQGKDMFVIARQALVDLSQIIAVRPKYLNNPNKFCHGYGIFQYDIQAFKTAANRPFFLQKKWAKFSSCLAEVIIELKAKKKRYYPDETTLDHDQLIYLAIGYNAHVDINGTFDQGYADGDGVHYGRYIEAYLDMQTAADLIA